MPESHANIVVIGGGAIGASVAYHLARAGAHDVLLLEKAQLTHGSTWHAAGLVGQLRSKRNLTRLMQNSVAVFDRLAAETGQEIDWRKVGSLRLASSEARWSEIKRTLTQARGFDFEAHALSPQEAGGLFPDMSVEGVVGAAYIPADGYVDPYGLTQAYAKGARRNGATLREGILVTDLVVENGRVVAAVTDHGTVACETVVNCAGLWARRVGEMAGVRLAAGVVEHQYLVTERTLDLPPGLTTLRDPDKNFYLKPDVNAYALGGWEADTKACWRSAPPWDFERTLFDSNFDRFEAIARGATERLPVLETTGVHSLINGPIPVSADGEPIMGPSPDLPNFFVACGFTAGIAASGGAGEAIANWILEGDPGMDLWPFDLRRFGPYHATTQVLEERAIEAYGLYYRIHWPGHEMASGRPARRSPFYDDLKARGAVYGAKFGWERPNWFARPGEGRGDDPVDRPAFEGRANWFAAVGEEHKAVREGVALIDQSSFAKFELTGPGAFAAIDRLAANEIGGPGRAVYTQLLNEAGGIEADLTVIRLAEDRFYLVTGSGFGVRDGGWIRAHLPADGAARLREVTGERAVLNLCGPRAREVLSAVTDDEVTNEGFPFLTAREIEIAFAPVLVVRVGYVGELGWELHIPLDHAAAVYRALRAAGEGTMDRGLRDVGYRAIESLRLEKGYLYWSADIGPDSNPYEAGLGFCVALDKGDFIGRTALERIRAAGPERRLVSFTAPAEAPLTGGEAILHQGEVVGTTTSGGYGYTLDRAIAFGYLPSELADREDFEIEAFLERWPAKRGLRCLYDPKNQRLRS
jgi:glycine cleavage system aminomethyltransferase T/glycine/D-amino acid oxidase-like deaminating enzyme